MTKPRFLLAAAVAAAVSACGVTLFGGSSGGDLAAQQPKYHIKGEIPPAPVRTPEDELKTFKLPPGFRMELVAAEPMVEEPIALAFDPDGRIYVVELRAYMPDAKGTGELDPIGRIKRLESSKGDGKYDKSTIFADKLIIPRAVGLAGDGVLVAEPPNVWFCRDTNGDGVADEKSPVFSDYGSRAPNPEHMANGLVPMLDNWYYNANWPARFRYSKGKFLRDGDASRGQWGIAQDDTGRLFFNTNGSMLRCDYVPAKYLTQNPYINSPAGLNATVASNATFPSRVNPGVNRGYTADVNDEGKLQRVTASCGPTIYRADQFPDEYRGNAFACEPAGNLVSRQVLTQEGVAVKSKSVQHDGVDFLTSTDERFRPVNLYTAPDGSLYVIDLYHGILQHKAYLSAYLGDQVERRHLDNNDGHRGRIWRIVHESAKPSAMPKLSKAPSAELVQTLSHPNGWWRDTAQRLLVERADPASVPLLAKVIAGSGPGVTPLAKIHALWALSGMEKLEDDIASAAAKDADARVRVAALRAGELMIRKATGPGLIEAAAALANDPDPTVQLQVLMLSSPDQPQMKAAGQHVLAAHLADALFRAAALNGAAGRELELLQSALTDKAFANGGRAKDELFNDLAECVVRSRSADRIEKLFDLIAAHPAKADQQAMLTGVNEALYPASGSSGGEKPKAPKAGDKTPKKAGTDPKATKPKGAARNSGAKGTDAKVILAADTVPGEDPAKDKAAADKPKAPARRLRLPHQPASLAKLTSSSDPKIKALAEKAEAAMSWPNKPGDTTPPLTPLKPDEEKRFAAGKELFTAICAACHQPSGLGQDGVAPPLVDSEWVLGPTDRVGRIVLNGLHGPIKVGRKTMDLEMPGLKVLDDEQIASVLTYVRREWGHEGSPIAPAAIAKVRKDTAERGDLLWTAEELQAIGGKK